MYPHGSTVSSCASCWTLKPRFNPAHKSNLAPDGMRGFTLWYMCEDAYENEPDDAGTSCIIRLLVSLAVTEGDYCLEAPFGILGGLVHEDVEHTNQVAAPAPDGISLDLQILCHVVSD